MPTFALISWPFVAILLFGALGVQRGLIWSIVLGYLFLPENFVLNPPGLPGYSKVTAIGLGALLGVLFFRGREPRDQLSKDNTVYLIFLGLALCLVLGPLLTMFVNRAPIFFGPVMRQGMGLWDIQNRLFSLFFILVPWLLAYRYLQSPKMHAEILRAVVVVGLFYTLLALYELRMSPQLNNMLYGYFPHHWRQHIRGGGYRPLVFLDHGLSLGFYLTALSIGAVALLREFTQEKRAFFVLSAVWCLLVLAISRNLGALALGLLFAPVMLMLSRSLQIKVAAIVVIAFMLNPLVRDVYVQPLQAAAQLVSDERYRSLKVRFDNEQTLLDRANLRPITGWGEWSRWRIHDENGQDITISDGTWIIVLSKWGWIGYVGIFGLLAVPVMFLARAARRREISYATTGMAVIVAANLIYLIPNATLSAITWMMAGALAGFVQFIPRQEQVIATEEGPEEGGAGRAKPVYTRFGPSSDPLPVRRQAQSEARARSPSALRR